MEPAERQAVNDVGCCGEKQAHGYSSGKPESVRLLQATFLTGNQQLCADGFFPQGLHLVSVKIHSIDLNT